MSDIYKFDFIVVGAGVIGIAIAMRCAQKKKSVLLIEKKTSSPTTKETWKLIMVT